MDDDATMRPREGWWYRRTKGTREEQPVWKDLPSRATRNLLENFEEEEEEGEEENLSKLISRRARSGLCRERNLYIYIYLSIARYSLRENKIGTNERTEMPYDFPSHLSERS